METKNPDLGTQIFKTGVLSEDSEKQLKEALNEFKGTFVVA